MSLRRALRRTLTGLGRLLTASTLVVVVAGLLAAPVLSVLLVGSEALGQVEDEVLDAPPLPDELPVVAELSTVHDRDGTRIAELAGEVRREPVAYDDIPQRVIDAVLATEDSGFFEHQGVEHEAMLRAASRNVMAGGITEGASTITQQYVKMSLLSPEQTLQRKLQEIVLAVELERRDSKEQILEGYLNAVYLGDGVYGVGTAADHYFSRSLDELDVAQAATLAGAIQAPSATNPVADAEAARDRRDVVIRQMRAQDRVTQEEADEALAQDIELDIRDRSFGDPFWVETVKRLIYDPAAELQPGLQEAVGASVEERIDAIFAGGLRIETTLDRGAMGSAEEAIAGHLTDATVDPMGALISVEHATGALRAFSLGPHAYGQCPDDDASCGSTTTNPTVPWGGGSGRQSGSSFKPFVAAAALQDGLDEQAGDEDADDPDDEQDSGDQDSDEDGDQAGDEDGDDLDPDEPLVYDSPSGEDIEGCGTEDEPYAPSNYNDSDPGVIDLDEAVQRSVNTYFAKLTRDVGVQRVAEVAQDHGLRWGNFERFGSVSCALGLGSADVFPLGVTTGYGTWANDGVRCDPYVVERVLDREGEVLYEHEPRCERVVEPDVAQRMRELLRGPVSSGGTAPGVGSDVGGDVFGKTGTTNQNIDAWFVGSTGDVTTSSWVGFERPQPMEQLTLGGNFYDSVTGGTVPASIWTEYTLAARE